MKKEVMITIEGRQSGDNEEPIIQKALGSYHYKNGKHYIQYEEKHAEQDMVSKNTIKIAPTQVVLTKKLGQTSQMFFDLSELTQTTYQTPYGDLTFDIITDSIDLTEEEDQIELTLSYSLSAEGEPVSNNHIIIIVSSI